MDDADRRGEKKSVAIVFCQKKRFFSGPVAL